MHIKQIMFTRWGMMLAFAAGIALPISTALQNISLPLIMLTAIVYQPYRERLKQIFREPLVIMCYALYLLLILGATWSSGTGASVFAMLKKMIGLIELPFIIAFFTSKTNRKAAFYGFSTAIVLTLVLSYITIIFNYPLFHSIKWGINYGVFRFHMYHCYFLALAACYLLYLLLHNKLKSNLFKILAVIGIVIILHNIYYETYSRTGHILTMVMMFLILIQWRLKTGILLSLAMLTVIVPLIVYTSPKVQQKLEAYIAETEQYKQNEMSEKGTSVGLRYAFHKYSKMIIMDKPILGYGTGSFVGEYKKKVDQYNNGNHITTNPHNDYLLFGVQLGFVGIAFFIGVLGTLLVGSRKLATPYRDFAVILAVSYAASCWQNSFFTDSVSGLAFFAIVGYLFATHYQKHNSSSKHEASK